ncbi:hypothetical protein LCGC14_1003530 [marine sediment metagenome]|uniref:Uncharacterized protein n=2 Tax=root TaxID=1 RepID=A0A0F9N2B9_9ZZZZ
MKIAAKTLLLAGIVLTPTFASANDFSTATRVQYVMDCLTANSQMNVYEGVHKCSCVIDKISEKFTQTQFEDLNTAYMYKNLPADRGATFRDDKGIKSDMKLFEETNEEAYKSCRLR